MPSTKKIGRNFGRNFLRNPLSASLGFQGSDSFGAEGPEGLFMRLRGAPQSVPFILLVATDKLSVQRHVIGRLSPSAPSTLHPAEYWEGRCKATWKRKFKLSWREAGPPNHHDDEVDSDQ